MLFDLSLVDGREMALQRESGLLHPSVVSAGNGAGDATRIFFLLVLVMAGGDSVLLNANDCLASRSLQVWRRASASSSSLDTHHGIRGRVLPSGRLREGEGRGTC